ncbi:hypothetical protein [Microbacterium sp. NPDC096154]|uniref:hypothetical protein n=1 Tax=Microbacterium sp. NPDC096154 TaxID=3155549 RepID=UPI00332E83D5
MTSTPPSAGSARRKALPGPPAATNRLTYDDDLFLRIHRALRTPLVNQMVWRFDAPLDLEGVQRLHEGLSRGPLNRRVVSGAVPGARDRWVRSSHTVPVRVHPAPLAAGEITAWLEAEAQIDLDPYDGPSWVLATAATAEGGSVLSYLVSHVVADGGMMVAALKAAQNATTQNATPQDGPVRRLPVDDLGAAQVTLRDEWRDARAQLMAAARGLRDARRLPPAPAHDVPVQRSADKPRPPRRADDHLPPDLASVFVDCRAADWHAAAEAAGGTANSLFIAIVVEILLAGGGAEAGRPVEVSLPVSTRKSDSDLRSNATSGVAIVVDTETRDGDPVVRDLAHIRTRSGAEFRGLVTGTRRDELEPLKPLLQMVPDALAKMASANAATPLALASNMGAAPSAVTAPLGEPTRSMIMRSVTQHATRGMFRRMRGGLTAWWNESGERCTLALLGFDESAFPDRAALNDAVDRVYRRWGLTPEPW